MNRLLAVTAAICILAPATLSAQRPVPLDTVRVTAGSRLVAGAAAATRSVDVLHRADIEALPALTIGDVLARAMGVDVQARSAAQADVSIRGSSYEQVLVLVDGVAVNDDQTGHFHLDTAVPLDMVERIEVLRGPAAAVYGSSAIGGVINIVTRRARADAGGRVQGGSFGALSASADAGFVNGGYGARISAGHDRADGHRAGTDHETTQARITADAPLVGGSLRFDAGHARRDFGANAFYAPFDSYEETRTTTSSLSWKSSGVATTVEPRLSFRRHEDDFILRRDNPSFYRNAHTTHQWSGEVVTRWVPRSDMRIALGGEAVRSSIESNSLGERTEDRGALFAEFAAGTADASLFTAGLRVDRHERFGTHLSPSLAAGYGITPSFRLRASAGTGFRAPTWTERYYTDPANIGNPDLAPEQFWTVELGTELRRGGATLEVAAFLREADDLIDWGRPEGAAPTAPWRTMNVEHATFKGIEGGLRASAGPVDLAARASLLSVDADETAGLASKYALRPLTRTASLVAAAPLGPIRLAVRGAHFRREGGAEWGLVDARVSGRAGAFELFADATNLLDAGYRDVSEQPAPGRGFSLGLRVRR